MSSLSGRYHAAHPASLAEGWQLERLTRPSRLFGANGMRTGADGRVYVAQVAGSQVSAIDIDSGEVETISPLGGDIVGPDDLAFDSAGNLYATEITRGLVSVRTPRGDYRVVNGDMPCANPITMHNDRLIAGECRVGGRIMELDRDSGEARVILADVPMPNAFEVGPDGKLYFPVMGANEIWRVDLDGGAPEVVATGLGVPDSVKFDSQGFIVSTQVASGQVLRIDPRTGEQTVLANIAPGLDNCTFVGDRLFVSSISGDVNEIVAPGEFRPLVPGGLQWPLDIAVGAGGELFVVDGGFTYTLQPGGELQLAGMLFSPGFPGYCRGAVASGPGEWLVTTANGQLARFRPAASESEFLADGFDQLMGVALTSGGIPVFAEFGTGRLLATEAGGVRELAGGLDQPKGVAVDGDACFVAEAGAGRVVRIAGGRRDTVVDGLGQPEGIAFDGKTLYVLDIASQSLFAVDPASGARRELANGLPVGAPEGVVRKQLGGVGDMCGPMGNFTGIAVAPDGVIYVCGDAEGSVLALHPA
ncbi:gluconolaconase [Mangrovimicrobium sediminis]|uniref:Gluconolaconase n=1 Tax=Mangrovimicrobium sediminis TaxID=2562682 RepID=A0A4Z0LVG3_9GAMM|nr:SMP-30/gluconolactonase/LRE family protein [Haliea sp. SAOS-164]TGD71045.1 gluconolaconase [Haliea sp. SAOS-164]